MMGTTKLSTIREQIRKSFKMSDADLLAWFNQQLEDRKQRPKVAEAEIEALRLLRDALGNEAKPTKLKRGLRHTAAAKK
jgi:hypothetical protein